MRKLLTFLIALAAAAFAVYSPASADTIKYSFDSGRQLPTAWGCMQVLPPHEVHNRQWHRELGRDVSTGGAGVAEIWSAPLPRGGQLIITSIATRRSMI